MIVWDTLWQNAVGSTYHLFTIALMDMQSQSLETVYVIDIANAVMHCNQWVIFLNTWEEVSSLTKDKGLICVKNILYSIGGNEKYSPGFTDVTYFFFFFLELEWSFSTCVASDHSKRCKSRECRGLLHLCDGQDHHQCRQSE